MRRSLALFLVPLLACTRKEAGGTFAGQLAGAYSPPKSAPVDLRSDTRITVTAGGDGADMTFHVLDCAVPVVVMHEGPKIVTSGETPVPPCAVDIPGRGRVTLKEISLQATFSSNDRVDLTMTGHGPAGALAMPPDFSVRFMGARE